MRFQHVGLSLLNAQRRAGLYHVNQNLLSSIVTNLATLKYIHGFTMQFPRFEN